MKRIEGYAGSTDLFKIDPRTIVTREGWNPRSVASLVSNLEDLKASIKENGFYSDKPVVLYRRGAALELLSGHRRLRAVLELIDEGVPIVSIYAVLDQSGDEGERFGHALAANQHGVPLEPLDEAHAFQRLSGYGWEPKRIAAKIGRSLSYVYGRLKLLEATSDVLHAVEQKEITQTDAVRVVERANKDGVGQSEVLDQAIAQRKQRKKKAASGWSSSEALAKEDELMMKRLCDDYGVAWVVVQLLAYADKEEVLDCIHTVALGESANVESIS